MIHKVQHHFNSLHVYCSIKRAGLSAGVARKIAGLYERLFHHAIYSTRAGLDIGSHKRSPEDEQTKVISMK